MTETERPAADLALLALSGAALVDLEASARALEARGKAEGDDGLVTRVAAILDAARERERTIDDLRRSREELADAQRLGQMGSFDWEIATDVNHWSDELYRIFGAEPQSFDAGSARWMAFVHPEDQDEVRHAFDHAAQHAGRFRLLCRIVRTDGEVRLLEFWGEVLLGEDRGPKRMRGICRDVTEQRDAEELARSSSDRLAAFAEATPDALLVVDRSGIIREANHQVETVLGYTREELVGEPIEKLLPSRFRSVHEDHRTRYFGNPHPRSMGVGLDLFARRKSGDEIPVDVALGTLSEGEQATAIAIVRDISERRRAEELAARLRDADLARQQALEINDNVVQGLVTALLRLELDDLGESQVADGLRKTLVAARGIISDLLGSRDIEPGSLVRALPADAAESHGKL